MTPADNRFYREPVTPEEPLAWYDADLIRPTLEFGSRPPVWGGNWKPLYGAITPLYQAEKEREE